MAGRSSVVKREWWRALFAHPRSGATAELIAFALGIAFVLAFAGFAALRLAYRFEVTWLESAMYQMTERRLAGASIYTRPSLGYVPCLYPPLYFDVSAGIARLLGYRPSDVSFLSMRLVSIVSSLALFILTCWLVRSKGGSPRWSVALGSVVLASYGRFEGWHDSSRVDSLYSLLVVAGVALLLEGRSSRSAVASGVVFGAATLTKQPAVVLMVLAALQVVVVRRPLTRVAWLVASSALTVVAYLAVTRELANPMLYHYLFAVPASHPLQARLFVRGLFFLPVTVPLLCVWISWALVELLRGEGAEWRELVSSHRWSVLLVAWWVATVFFRAKQGASINFFLPLVPIMVVAAAENADHVRRVRSRLAHYVPYLPALQLASLVYDPRPLVPTDADARTASQLVEQLRKVDGPVWFSAFPSYAALAGKPWFSHQVAQADVASTDPDAIDGPLSRAVEGGVFGGLLLSPGDPLAAHPALARYRSDALPEVGSAFLRRLHHDHVGTALLVRPASAISSDTEPAQRPGPGLEPLRPGGGG